MVHELKILPQYFDPVARRTKTFELRKDDRNYQLGDELLLREWDGDHYTGRRLHRYVVYIYHGHGDYGLAEGYCILGLKASPIPSTTLDGGR